MSESSRSYVVKSRGELIAALGIFVIASPHNIIALASLLTKNFELYFFFIQFFQADLSVISVPALFHRRSSLLFAQMGNVIALMEFTFELPPTSVMRFR
jgi:hypothetical protein